MEVAPSLEYGLLYYTSLLYVKLFFSLNLWDMKTFDCNVRSCYFNFLNVVLVKETEPADGQFEILYRKYNSCDTYVPFHF